MRFVSGAGALTPKARCSVKLLKRGPTGKFIGYSQALHVWLPVLLDDSRWVGPLDEMLRVAARWCESQAAQYYKSAALALEERDDWGCPAKQAEVYAGEAARWFRRREILERTIEELKKA